MSRLLITASKVSACIILYAAIACHATAQPLCTLKSLDGGYGFGLTGTNEGLGVSYAISGIFRSDGAGDFEGSGTQSVSGSVAHVKFSGTYTVSADCSGTAHLIFESGAKATIDFFLVENGTSAYLIASDTRTLETGTAKKQMTDR